MGRPWIIGLTGGIGSGKTTCAKVFELLGAPVYYADDRAKALYTEDDNLRQDVVALLGPESYSGNQLQRAYVGSKVFEDPSLLQKLETLVHPRVKLDFDRWLASNGDTEYVLREAAILIESGSYKDCDRIICVVANEKERIRRVMKRDATDETSVRKRLSQQLSDEDRLRYADFKIETDSDQSIIQEIERIHASILKSRLLEA